MNDTKIFGEICESRLIGFKGNFRRYNLKEISEFIFLYFLSLKILKSEFQTEVIARDYARRTLMNGNFDDYRPSGSDLYLLLHVLIGKNNSESFGRLKDQKQNQIFYEKINIDQNSLKRWLRMLASGKEDVQFDRRFLLKLERDLRISNSDYKNMRRVITNWTQTNEKNKKIAMTRLMYAFQSRLRRSELYTTLFKLAKNEGWKLSNTKNPEKHSPSTSSQIAKAIALGSVIIGGATAYSLYKMSKERKPVKEYVYKIDEVANAGATGAGAVAGIPLPLISTPKIIRRNKKTVKKSDKK